MKSRKWISITLLLFFIAIAIILLVADYFDWFSSHGLRVERFNSTSVGAITTLISCIIAGALTMIGVYVTIDSNKKESEESTRLIIKPLFYCIRFVPDDILATAQKFQLKKENTTHPMKTAVGIVKNTDNGILIIDKFSTEQYEYYPINGNIVDKNSIFMISADIDNNDSLITPRLHVKDVLDNKYVYDIEIKTYKSGNIEFKSFCEIKEKAR